VWRRLPLPVTKAASGNNRAGNGEIAAIEGKKESTANADAKRSNSNPILVGPKEGTDR